MNSMKYYNNYNCYISGAKALEVVVMNTLSVNLHLAMVSVDGNITSIPVLQYNL